MLTPEASISLLRPLKHGVCGGRGDAGPFIRLTAHLVGHVTRVSLYLAVLAVPNVRQSFPASARHLTRGLVLLIAGQVTRVLVQAADQINRVLVRVAGQVNRVLIRVVGQVNCVLVRVAGQVNGVLVRVAGQVNGVLVRVAGQVNGVLVRVAGQVSGVLVRVAGQVAQVLTEVIVKHPRRGGRPPRGG